MTLPLLLIVGVFGLMIGSFLNVCIARLPNDESIVKPPSHCPKCNTPIKWYDNIPVLSYLALGAKCRACRAPISIRYPLVEITTAVAFVLQAIAFPDDPILLASRLVFTAMLIVLFGTDYDTQRLPNVITLPGIVVGLVFSLFAPPGIIASVIGAALGAAILQLVRWSWRRLRGFDGMGFGDVKMLAMIGAFLGWRQIWVVLFIASLTGAVLGVVLSLGRGRSMQTRLPFGTFLAIAAYVASIVGERLLTWYLGLYA
ncbi:MAG TPA: prepilin peptidase [Vicinamibacterales bacterium]|nr:prepilin peptidase [Vicinamibacterales bacterium]